MESRRFEEMGRGWADTAHTTELQLASVASSVSDDSGGDAPIRRTLQKATQRHDGRTAGTGFSRKKAQETQKRRDSLRGGS